MGIWMRKVGIVILNYDTYSETINCINSILRHKLNIEKIVIVDNASKNDSYSILKNTYKQNNKIHVIKTHRNVGFAKGNNEGILFLRKRGISHVLLLNNDTIILNDDYLEKMLYKCTKNTGIIGSKIKLLYGIEQGMEKEDISLGYSLYHFISALCKYCYIYLPFVYIHKKMNGKWVHGCSILLTPSFFDKYECLWPYTFLYREEMILSIMMEKSGLKTKISDSYIFHKAAKTTKQYWDEGSRQRNLLEVKSSLQQLIVRILPYYALKIMIGNYANERKK